MGYLWESFGGNGGGGGGNGNFFGGSPIQLHSLHPLWVRITVYRMNV